MKENYKIEINNLIALYHIMDDFEEFERKLKPLISTKYNRDFVYNLWKISRGKFTFGAFKARKFYKENKAIIDTIGEYSDISSFINRHYDWQGNQIGNLHFFYQYLIEHKNEIDKILAVLEKLKELGFTSFEFNEDLDFTKETYNINQNYNSVVKYVDNIKMIPHYENYIKYGTTSSNYKMELSTTIKSEFSKYGRKIILNSLLFDVNRLPEKIDKETIINPILKLKEEQQEKSAPIRNSVDINVSIFDLETRLGYTTNTISRLEGVKNKKELLEVLSNMKQDVEKLRTLSSEYDSSVTENEPTLTPDVLEKEKSEYVRRREWRNLDID